MNKEKLKHLVRETGMLRADLAAGASIEEGSLTVELSNRDLAAIVYALAQCWLTEYVSGVEGYEVLLDFLGEASSTILAADADVDGAINQILSKENPEAEADGA